MTRPRPAWAAERARSCRQRAGTGQPGSRILGCVPGVSVDPDHARGAGGNLRRIRAAPP